MILLIVVFLLLTLKTKASNDFSVKVIKQIILSVGKFSLSCY